MTSHASDPTVTELTHSQMRMLLDVALQEDPSAASHQRRIDAEQAIVALGARVGVATTGLFNRIADGSPSVGELRAAKDLAKRLMSESTATSREREAAQLLYYATIAAAFCMHAAQISTEPVHKRHEIYVRLARFFWGDSLGDLFERAAAARRP